MKKLFYIISASIFTCWANGLNSQTNGAGAFGAGSVGVNGTNRCFLGNNAGLNNVTAGADNTFLGIETGYYNTSQSDNTFVGYRAGHYNGNGDTEVKSMFN